MPFKGSPEQNPSRIKIRNADGTVNIHCFKCGHFICTMSPVGIFTSLCHWCATGEPRPLTPQEELLQQIYSEDQGTIEQLAKPKTKFNILEMMVNTFEAIGFGRRKKSRINKDEIQYPTSDNETSVSVARRKKREPIFKFNKDKNNG